jgi:hypothetical protein
MSYKPLAISRPGVELEKQHALRDVLQWVYERGREIIINLHTESTIKRDDYNSIINKDDIIADNFTTYAYPLEFNPTTKQQEKAGIREDVDCIAWTSTQAWLDAGYSISRLKEIDSIRATIIIDDSKYEISEKNHVSDFSDTFLYVVLGLNKV